MFMAYVAVNLQTTSSNIYTILLCRVILLYILDGSVFRTSLFLSTVVEAMQFS